MLAALLRFLGRRFAVRPPARRLRPARLAVESLEGRWVPAGTVSVSLQQGLLSLVGDASANFVTLQESSKPGTFTITGNPSDPTDPNTQTLLSYNGQLPDGNTLTLTGIQGIAVDLGGADAATGDILSLIGNGGSSGNYLGQGLSVTSTGNLGIVQDTADAGFDVAGPILVNHSAGGSLFLSLGGTGDVLGPLTVNQGAGNSNILLGNGSAAVATRLSGGVTLNAADGDNAVTLSNVNVTGGLTYQGGDGADSVLLQGVTLAGNLQVNAGGGVNALGVIGGSTVRGNLDYDGGGTELVQLAGSTLQGYAHVNGVSADGDVTVNVGQFADGSDAPTLARATIGSDLKVSGGQGNLIVTVDNSTVGGDVDLSLVGNGVLQLDLQDGSSILGNVSFNLPGSAPTQTASYTAVLDNVTVAGFVSLNAAGSTLDSSVTVENTTHRGLGSLIGSYLSATDGTGNLNIALLDNTYLGDNVGAWLGGTGTLGLTIADGSLVNGNVFNNLPGSAPSWATVNAAIHQAAVKGFVSLNAAAAAVAAVADVQASSIAGFFSLIGGTGDDSVSISSSAVGNNVGLKLGNGQDTVTVSGSQFEKSFGLVEGNGDNLFAVESGNPQGGTTFFGPVSYTAGSGKNTVTLGADSSNQAIFDGPATFSTSGSGTLDQGNAVFNDAAASSSGFSAAD